MYRNMGTLTIFLQLRNKEEQEALTAQCVQVNCYPNTSEPCNLSEVKKWNRRKFLGALHLGTYEVCA